MSNIVWFMDEEGGEPISLLPQLIILFVSLLMLAGNCCLIINVIDMLTCMRIQ